MQKYLKTVITSVAVLLFATCLLQGAERITLEHLLNEMTSRDTIARFPEPAYTNRQSSSYDRNTKSRNEGWFANGDRSYFVRTERNGDGRIEHVMLEADGPGAIVRFWATVGAGHLLDGLLRIYIDDTSKPAFVGKLGELVGEDALVGYPLASTSSPLSPRAKRGNNLYLPIPYAKRCKVTYEKTDGKRLTEGVPAWPNDALFYNINYRTYTAGTSVEGLTASRLRAAAGMLDKTQHTLDRAPVNKGIFNTDTRLEGLLAAGESRSVDITAQNGTGASIRGFTFLLKARDLVQALRSTVLEMVFDGERTVWCPVGDFFGTGYHIRETKSWYSSVSADGLMQAHWVMPFRENAQIILHNLGEQSIVIVNAEIASGDWLWDERSMYFGASWHQLSFMRSKPDRDLNFVTLEGQGVYVGDSLTLFDGHKAWWGEGDEKIFVDGEDFPSHFGTGTEDYYGYAWCLGPVFATPFVAQPDGTGNEGVGFTVNSRFRLLDGIPFTARIQFDMELMHWRDTFMHYAPTTYWYGRPGCRSNIQPDIENARLKVAQTSADVIPKPDVDKSDTVHTITYADLAADYTQDGAAPNTTAAIFDGTVSGIWTCSSDDDTDPLNDANSLIPLLYHASVGLEGGDGYAGIGGIPNRADLGPLPIVSDNGLFDGRTPPAGTLAIHPGHSEGIVKPWFDGPSPNPYLVIQYTATADLENVSVEYSLERPVTGDVDSVNFAILDTAGTALVPTTNVPAGGMAAGSQAVGNLLIGESIYLVVDDNGQMGGDQTFANVRIIPSS